MKRFILVAAWLCVIAAPVIRAQDWAQTRLEKSSRHLEWITVKHDGREVGCYVGYPERSGKAPVVLVIHEIYGLSDWARLLVDELAEAGYIAIAPDLLWGLGRNGGGTSELAGGEIGQKIRTLPPAQITADLNAALEHMRGDVASNGKTIVVGFCWGGGESFRFATNNDVIRAAVVFYGGAPAAADMARIAAPVYGFYGGNDARVTAGVPRAVEEMKAAGKTYVPVVYEGAGHGFMRAGDAPPPPEVKEPAAEGDEKARTAFADYQKKRAAYEANVKARTAAWKRLDEIIRGL